LETAVKFMGKDKRDIVVEEDVIEAVKERGHS
jgi:hypothetical protein